MRLHALEVTAFGPFADTVRVDFDALADAGLFLVTGQTGAGKTSLLDAVCFALYGAVPGLRHGGPQRGLRSHHAAPDARPEVRLECTVRGRRLRVTRWPQWERTKRRGEGTTTEQARVLLEERRAAGGWTVLSTRADEAGHLLQRLVGLTAEQFCQVVLLPQGRFADFLRADADTRRALLESLFATEQFRAVEQALVARRQQAAREVDRADAAERELLARAAEVAGRPPAGAPAAEPPERWLERLLAEAVAARDAAERRRQEADTARRAAAAAVNGARDLADRQARRARVLARARESAARAEERAALARRIGAARTALPLVPLVADVRQRAEAAGSARAAAQDRVRAVPEGSAAPGGRLTAARPSDGRSDPAALRARTAQWQVELGSLAVARRAEADVVAIATEVARVEQAVVQLGARRSALDAEQRRLDRVEPLAVAALDAARAAEAAVDAARERAQAARERRTAARRRDELLAEVAHLRDRVAAAAARSLGLREDWLDLRQRRLDGVAAELATGLVDGEPCAVCGSRRHPSPAPLPPGGVPDLAADRAAEERWRAADASAGELRTEVARREQAAESAAHAARNLALPAASALAAEATARLGELELRASLRPPREALRRGLGQRRAALQQDLLAVVADERRLVAQQDGLLARQSELHAVVEAARGDDPSIDARCRRLERLAADADAGATALERAERAERAAVEAVQRLDREARAVGLADADDAARAVECAAADAHPRALEELVARERALDDDEAAVRAALADPDLVGVEERPAADVSGSVAALERAEAAHDAATREQAVAVERAGRLGRLLDDVRALRAARRPADAALALHEGLAGLAEGKSADNRLRMSLSGYVLAARLEQVAAAASDRLVRMSGGRYTVRHEDRGTGARERGGLHLRVVDAWTGVERPPLSLSGGELFLTSLALALGLADVVVAEAGGTELETLFVDEGFGSLDDATLDDVMDVLDGLREGGRCVGLVSHVSELRQRVPTQLHVRKGRAGSTTELLGGDDDRRDMLGG